jgi:type IV pilus assembly protein PilV
MKHSRNPQGRRSPQGGMALIEALVGVLIFAFGIIGLVGLQVAMTRAQGAAKFRSDAAYLGSQVVGAMWADRANLASYNTDSTCAAYAACKDWTNKVASTLPAGTASLVASSATGDVALTITWSTNAEGTHTHVLNTSIR